MNTASSGTSIFNDTTFNGNIGSAGSNWYSFGVWTIVNSGTVIIMINTQVIVKVPAYFYSTYFSIFSNNVYSYANETIINASVNVSNGTNFAYMYGLSPTSNI